MLRRDVSRRSWTLLLIVAGVWEGFFMLTAIAIRDLSGPVVACFARMDALVLLPIALRRGALADLGGRSGPFSCWEWWSRQLPSCVGTGSHRPVGSGGRPRLIDAATGRRAHHLDDHGGSRRGHELFGLAVGTRRRAAVRTRTQRNWTAPGAAMLLLGALSYALGGFMGEHRLAACHRLARSQARWWAEASRSRPLRWQLCPTTLRLSAR